MASSRLSSLLALCLLPTVLQAQGAEDPAALARGHRQLADLYLARGELGLAEMAARTAVTAAIQALGPEDPRTAEAHLSLATVLEAKGDFREAADSYDLAVRSRRTYFLKDGWTPGGRARQATVLRAYAEVLGILKEYEKAWEMRDRAKDHEDAADREFKASLRKELQTSTGVVGPTSEKRRTRLSIVVNGEEFRDLNDFAESRRGY